MTDTPIKYGQTCRHLSVWALVGFLLAALGGRLLLVWQYGSPLPWRDDWPFIYNDVLARWVEGASLLDIIRESTGNGFGHIILFTRMIQYGLIYINGQFDPLFFLVFNATISLLPLLILLLWMRRALHPQFQWAGALLLLFFWIQPLFAQNLLWAYQTQFSIYFFLVLGGMYGFLAPGVGRWARCFSYTCLLLMCLTMGGGLVAGLTILAVWGAEKCLFRASRFRWPHVVSLLSVALCLGVFYYQAHTGEQEKMIRESFDIEAIIYYGSRILAWPFLYRPYMLVVCMTPLVVLLFLLLRHRRGRRLGRQTRLAIVFGILAGLQLLFLIAARYRTRYVPVEDFIHPRHFDLISYWLLANFIAAFGLWQWGTRLRGGRGQWMRVCCFLWCALLLCGVLYKSVGWYGAGLAKTRISSTRNAIQRFHLDFLEGNLVESKSRYLAYLPPEVNPTEPFTAEDSPGGTLVTGGSHMPYPTRCYRLPPKDVEGLAFESKSHEPRAGYVRFPIEPNGATVSLVVARRSESQRRVLQPIWRDGTLWGECYLQVPEERLLVFNTSQNRVAIIGSPKWIGVAALWTRRILPYTYWLVIAGAALLIISYQKNHRSFSSQPFRVR